MTSVVVQTSAILRKSTLEASQHNSLHPHPPYLSSVQCSRYRALTTAKAQLHPSPQLALQSRLLWLCPLRHISSLALSRLDLPRTGRIDFFPRARRSQPPPPHHPLVSLNIFPISTPLLVEASKHRHTSTIPPFCHSATTECQKKGPGLCRHGLDGPSLSPNIRSPGPRDSRRGFRCECADRAFDRAQCSALRVATTTSLWQSHARGPLCGATNRRCRPLNFNPRLEIFDIAYHSTVAEVIEQATYIRTAQQHRP